MWKEIEGYEGYYEVSDCGEVRSLDRCVIETRGRYKGNIKRLKGGIMKQSFSAGYPVVNLRKNATSWVVPVHRLVAIAFIPNPYGYTVINHIDGNKLNNHVSNLEWVTYAENNIHALHMGLRKPRGNPIAQYDLQGNLISTYDSTCEAARATGCSRGGISHCLNGRTSQSCGYIWKKLSKSPTTIPHGSTREDELPAEAQRLS